MVVVQKGPARSLAKERFWRGHVSGQVKSGLSARGYCREHGLSEHSFYAWRRELARRDEVSQAAGPQFAEVVLTGEAPVASRLALQIHLADARIEVFPDCDRATLELALAALRGAAC